jgi:hypothetical protein
MNGKSQLRENPLNSNMKEIIMPPSRVCGICKNTMGELCLENCASKGDFSQFNPDMEKPLELIPKLTFEEYLELPGSIKGKWLFIQNTKILEALNGDETGNHLYRSSSRRVFKNLEKQSVLPCAEGANTLYQNTEERKDKGK